MRTVAWALIGVASFLAGTPARAYDVPAIVIPGKVGVPVIIDGVDASYCVVEGDWGLARPGHGRPTIVVCPPLAKAPAESGRYYYPSFGRRPGYGRLEVEPPPNRRLPRPAPSYYREWGTQSDPLPANTDPPANVDINVDAQVDWRRRRTPANHATPRRSR